MRIISLISVVFIMANTWSQKLEFERPYLLDTDTNYWRTEEGTLKIQDLNRVAFDRLPRGKGVLHRKYTDGMRNIDEKIIYEKSPESSNYSFERTSDGLKAGERTEFIDFNDSTLSEERWVIRMENGKAIFFTIESKYDLSKGVLKSRTVNTEPVKRTSYTYSPEGELLQGETLDSKGKRHGPTTLYFPDGTPHLTVQYVNGKADKLVSCQDQEGNPMDCGSLMEGTGVVQSHLDCDCKDKTIHFYKGKHVSEEVYYKKTGEKPPTPSEH